MSVDDCGDHGVTVFPGFGLSSMVRRHLNPFWFAR